tara:strand:- start:1 stop:573 length:573 start_codon:yes stop_codon:yes gene_type:complete
MNKVNPRKFLLTQNKKFTLISLKTKNLKKKQILSICKLKNSYWSWTIPKQLEWYKKKTKKTDINNMLLINNKLIGYTLLRKRKAIENNKFFIYYYFDSFILHKKFRNKGLAEILILFNNKILNKLKPHSFLICPTKMIPFYLKYNWKILPKNKFKIMDHKTVWFKGMASIRGMTYNLDKKVKKKIFYFFN